MEAMNGPLRKYPTLITAMVTPFSDSGDLYEAQAKRLAQALVASGSGGLVVSGTTGESPTLSHEEKLRLFTAVREAVGDRAMVIAGTSSYNTAESIALSKEAEQLGVDALLLVTPYYNKPPQEGLYQHFAAIANAVRIPCMLYNVPSRTSINLAAETTIRLSQIDNIIGVKEASGDLALEQTAAIVAGAAPGFRVWSGDDNMTLPMMSVGAYGVVSVASHFVGRQLASMIEAHANGRVDEAAGAHRRLLPLFKGLFLMANPIPVKYALNRVGLRVGPTRLPLIEADDKTKAALDELLSRYQLDLPVEAVA
jgi:4-hydroxy-tetrahydrodipicolinate synthase